MSTEILDYNAVLTQLPAGGSLIIRDVSWEDYEALLEAAGESPGLRISYDCGTLQIMTVSSRHESYAELIKRFVDVISLKLRIRVLFFGSMTMKKQAKMKGAEPDACFYVESAAAIGSRNELDLSSDPPPDIVVEVDVHHDSISRLPIYAGLGVQEFWRYDLQALTIQRLEQGEYVAVERSHSLPVLSAALLTEFLARSQREDQFETLLAFESWLQTQHS